MPNYIGTVTRKSNGAIEFTPSDAGAFAKLPAMGDEVTIDVTVTKTAVEIEDEQRAKKAARVVPPVEVSPATKRVAK